MRLYLIESMLCDKAYGASTLQNAADMFVVERMLEEGSRFQVFWNEVDPGIWVFKAKFVVNELGQPVRADGYCST